MSSTDNNIKKESVKGKPGRPRVSSIGLMVRLREPEVIELDKWAENQTDKPGRPEAVRRLMRLGITGK
jgi:hypothetical protein